MRKKVVGLTEKVDVIGKKKVSTEAKFDTGAKGTSIDFKVASEARLGPIIGTTRIKQASLKRGTYRIRPVVKAHIKINGMKFSVKANLEDRHHSKQKVRIGRDVIHSKFIVDIEKTHKSAKISDKK